VKEACHLIRRSTEHSFIFFFFFGAYYRQKWLIIGFFPLRLSICTVVILIVENCWVITLSMSVPAVLTLVGVQLPRELGAGHPLQVPNSVQLEKKIFIIDFKFKK
jgi:hypothetical protein